tara:strand:+ start:700 stop:828 length:129 start_codon:yes stop_codon:yes gene_type:complete
MSAPWNQIIQFESGREHVFVFDSDFAGECRKDAESQKWENEE